MTSPALIDGHYRVLSTLGSGATGEIFEVEGPEGRSALKLLRHEVEGLADDERIATFKFEFSLLKGLQHPNIVRIFDFGYDAALRRFYFTQELIAGRSLDRFAAEATPAQMRELFVQALQGLAYLHAQDVLHGDLKPENLLVTDVGREDPQLKIIDFGISHPSLAGTGGTPPYIAPEKILKEPSDARSDLYSLAVVFYALLTGANPFLQKNVFATLRAHLHFFPPPATTLRKEVDPVWSALLDRMLAKNPRQRLASAEDGLRFLETQGEIPLGAAPPKHLPDHFAGREEILERAKAFLQNLPRTEETRVLLVTGEKGLGKNALLTELKYDAELREIEIVAPGETARRRPAVSFLSAEAFAAQRETGALDKLLAQASLVVALRPEQEAEADKAFGARRPELLRLRPLNVGETEAYLREVTRNPKIPAPLLQGLHQWSRGYPGPLREALQSLLKDPLIVDSSGKWRLAVFEEAGPDLSRLELTEGALAHALEGELGADPRQHWRLELRRTEALALQGKFDAALALLAKLEAELEAIFERPGRLLERARLLEARGWIYTKQLRYQEARADFASGLSLLRECDSPAPVPELRLRNFIAFLDLQEGRLDEAIAAFEATAARAAALDPNERRRVTNNELANAYLAAGRVSEGIRRLEADLEFFATHSNPSFRMKVGYNLGEAYLKDKNIAAAADAYLRVAELARGERHWEYLIRAYNGLGNVRSQQQRPLESLDYYQRSLSLAEYSRDYMSAATVAQNRGVLLSELGRLDEAIHDLELSKRLVGKIHPSSHTRSLMARATLELGEVHRKRGDFAKARAAYTEAQNRSEEDPNLKPFRFYPIAALATLALAEGDFATFRELSPKLIYLAETEEEKKALADLLAQAPEELRQGRGPAPRAAAMTAPSGAAGALANILRINRALLTERDPRFLFQKILQYAAELCGAETALLLVEEEGGSLAVRDAFNTEVDAEQIEISQQIARKVLTGGASVVTADAQVDSGFNQFQSVVALHLRSIACVPIRAHQKVVGLLYLTHRYKTGLFSPETLELLEAYGDQAGLALQNLRYLEQLKTLNAQLQNRLEEAEEEIDRLKTDLRSKVKNPYARILGKSRAIVETLKLLDRVSDTNLSVLILGETGSGKELIARSLHEHSRRRKGPFVAVNCGAIPENLMESELFGYRAGAFTGATRDKRGLLEEANGGTLFLDEIAELPLNTQAKLLRALQEREIVRLGDTKVMTLDIRIVAATHRHLEGWVKEGKFREDLFYRVAQMVLNLPALRERKEDLFLLAEHFLERAAQETNAGKTPRLSMELRTAMAAYPWPGNVRELENFLRAAAAFAERGLIRLQDLPEFLRRRLQRSEASPEDSPSSVPPASTPAASSAATEPVKTGGLYRPGWTWERYEEALYAQALHRNGMNCERAAAELGVGVATVYVKLRKFQLKTRAAPLAASAIGGPGLKLEQVKRQVVSECYRHHRDSPYAAAKELDINVGTVYRQLPDAKRR